MVNQTQNKHTPGPWVAKQTIVENNPDYLWVVTGPEWGASTIAIVDTPERAQLIAQAPTLLEVLESALQYIKYNGPTPHDNDCACSYCSIVAGAQHVINKAKGAQA